MSGRATHGSFYTVGLVSTPAPQHLSSTTTATTASASTFTGTYTTTPMQHLASMSSGHTLPPLSFVSDAATLAPPRLTASNTPPPSSSPPSFASPPTISGSPPPSSSVSSSFVPSPSSSSLEPPVSLAVSSTPPSFPRYGRGGSTFSSRLTATTRPGVMTTLTRPSVVTTRSPGLATLTTHGPTVTTYTTYNPALNKFTTHTPVTTTSLPSASSSSSSPHPSSAFLRYTPTSSRFVSLTTTTTTVTPPPRQAPTVYTLSPNLADNAGPSSAEPGSNFPPPPKVTLASTSTLHRPGPAWPLRVTLGASEGYDNLHLDVGEEEAAPKPQVRTHMTKEEFLAAPQPGLELLETGDKAEATIWGGRRGWPSGQERLEERRRGGVWSMSLFPTSTSTSTTTTFTTTRIVNTTTATTTINAAPLSQRHLPATTATTSTFTGGYCNQAVEAEGEDGSSNTNAGVWTVEGGQALRRNRSPPFPDPCTPPPERDSLTPPPHPDASDTPRFTLRDVPLKGEEGRVWVRGRVWSKSVEFRER
ncbi:mucin-2-like [Portunus trituberculatus]|uniref:mucin-2-like n=1 Tax=Portunus trituberculatus TaxID=210409 RepID=UPI001E1D0A5A|nr:mucin-2-like [Portunus trituberculatus]